MARPAKKPAPAEDALIAPWLSGPTKRAKIAGAAAELFMEHGFGATSMDEIARHAGVSKATVYAHFNSKAELFAALIRSASQVRLPSLFEVETAETDPRAALEEILRRLAEYAMAPRALRLYRVVVAEAGRFPELGDAFYRAGPNLVIARLAELIAKWRDKGWLEVENPRRAAELLYGMARGDLHMRRLLGVGSIRGASEGSPALIREAAKMFFAAYAKPGKRR